MTRQTDHYAEYVEHPRFGRGPRITGLNPRPFERGAHLHWIATDYDEVVANYERVLGEKWPHGNLASYSRPTCRIAHTAILADLKKQTPATVAVTHYFDVERACRDCGRMFIFFAEEQKYWYEELGFSLNSDCVRCVECRKRQQGLERKRETYEALFHVESKTAEQLLEMADACLSLIEAGVFTRKQAQRVRSLLNAVPDDDEVCHGERFADLMTRVITADKLAE